MRTYDKTYSIVTIVNNQNSMMVFILSQLDIKKSNVNNKLLTSKKKERSQNGVKDLPEVSGIILESVVFQVSVQAIIEKEDWLCYCLAEIDGRCYAIFSE